MDIEIKQKILESLKDVNSSIDSDYISPKSFSNQYSDNPEDKVLSFAENFVKNGGNFIYCQDNHELKTNLNKLIQKLKITELFCLDSQLEVLIEKYSELNKAQNYNPKSFTSATITSCQALIARTGSIISTSEFQMGRTSSLISDYHIVIASANQILNHLYDYLEVEKKELSQLPSMINITSSNSKTADIEKTLVNGAHGPKKLYILLIV